jgi:hypothetical protein
VKASPVRGADDAVGADVTVWVDLEQPELAGQVIVARQPDRAFRGWLDLLAALDQALERLRADTRHA